MSSWSSAPEASASAPPAGWPATAAGPTAGPVGTAGDGLRSGGADYPSGPPSSWPAHAPLAPTPYGPYSGVGGTPPGPAGPDGTRSGLAAVIAVVAVVAILGMAIWAIGAFGESDETAGGDDSPSDTVDLSDPSITAPPSEDPIIPTVPGPPAAEDPTTQARPLEEVLPELIDFVEQTRGQEFTTEPLVEAVPDAEFEDELAAASAGEEEALTAASVTDVALGLAPPGTDLAEVSGQAGAAGVLGFYDPESEELFVKGEVVTPFVQAIIVHELTHALDDQVFDLARLDALVEQPDESAFGFLALVEGTAELVRESFVAQMGPDDRTAYESEQVQLGIDQLPAVMGIPPAFLVEQQVPYASGLRFVQALVDEGGTAEIDTAYGEPPTTSEQILDPAVYLAGEGAVALRPLEADGEVAEQGGFGAADLRLLEIVSDPMGALLDPMLGTLEPIDGFGGGQFVSWADGQASCIRFEVVGDDAAASVDLLSLVEDWAAAAPGADVSTRVGGGGVDVVTAERCA